MLLITSGLYFLQIEQKHETISYSDSIIIGIAQGVAALLPEFQIWSTISTSILLGNDKSKAARFSS